MNDARRKSIRAALAKVAEARADLEAARDEEQEAFDALPEGLQAGDRGQAMEGAVDGLTEACDSLETLESDVEGLL